MKNESRACPKTISPATPFLSPRRAGMTIAPTSSSLWGIYHGLLAAGPDAGTSSAMLERAALSLEARSGFEEASAFLRSAAASDDQGLQRRAWAFLGRRDLAAALMPQALE